jgi:hypothetical protein
MFQTLPGRSPHYITPTKKGRSKLNIRSWATQAPTPAPYHLESATRPFYPSLRQHHYHDGIKEDPEGNHETD